MESWKERLLELLQGYSSNNIYNLDETGCFWRALPESGFGIKGVKCHGGKKSKHRITVVLIVNMSTLPVHYYSQAKAWMNGEILGKVLTKLNPKFSSQCRNVALLLDNAGCHPQELKGKYSNKKLFFCLPTLHPNYSLLMLELFRISKYITELFCYAMYSLKLTKPPIQLLILRSL